MPFLFRNFAKPLLKLLKIFCSIFPEEFLKLSFYLHIPIKDVCLKLIIEFLYVDHTVPPDYFSLS